MGKCIVCGKEATKFAWTMYSDDGQAIPSSLDTFGWCDEHYLDRHKYVIFENEDALELFKRQHPDIYSTLNQRTYCSIGNHQSSYQLGKR